MEKVMRMDKGYGDVEGDRVRVLIPSHPGATRPVPPAAVALHAAHLPGLCRGDRVPPCRGQGLGWHPAPAQGARHTDRGPPAPRRAGGPVSPALPAGCLLSPSPVALSSPRWGGGRRIAPPVLGGHVPPSYRRMGERIRWWGPLAGKGGTTFPLPFRWPGAGQCVLSSPLFCFVGFFSIHF